MRLPWEERREFFQDARRARYLARVAGKSADLIVAMSLWHVPGAAGVILKMIQVGQELDVKTIPAKGLPGYQRSRVAHVTELKAGRYRGHMVVGLVDFRQNKLKGLNVTRGSWAGFGRTVEFFIHVFFLKLESRHAFSHLPEPASRECKVNGHPCHVSTLLCEEWPESEYSGSVLYIAAAH